MLHYKMHADVAATAKVTPPILFSCPFRAGLTDVLQISSVDDVVAIAQGLPESTSIEKGDDELGFLSHD